MILYLICSKHGVDMLTSPGLACVLLRARTLRELWAWIGAWLLLRNRED